MLQFILTLASVVAAVVPMFGYLAALWWFDRYDREPLWLVALTFGWGALVATSLSLIGNTTLHVALAAVLGEATAGMVTPVVVAPLIEEPTKAAILFLVIMSRQFDNTTDGFVYGAATGLGFGMTENLLYFMNAAAVASFDPLGGTMAWLTTVAARTFFSALMHATASSLVGAGLGLTRLRNPLVGLLTVPLGFAGAIGMHALWNGLLTAASTKEALSNLAWLDFALFPLQFFGVFALFQLCLWTESRMIRAELAAEAREHGTLPEAHADPLGSWHRRSLTRFAPKGVDQAVYSRIATTLAFRRLQARKARGARQVRCQRDVDRLRLELAGLLEAG
jgi:protease PrsW